MVRFSLLSSEDDTHVLSYEIFVGVFKRVNWHLDFDFFPSACDVCSLELKKQKIWSTKKQEEERKKVSRSTRFGTLRRRNTKERSSREIEDYLETILTNYHVFLCFLLQKKRVKRDFVEDIAMSDSPMKEVQKNLLQCYPESST